MKIKYQRKFLGKYWDVLIDLSKGVSVDNTEIIHIEKLMKNKKLNEALISAVDDLLSQKETQRKIIRNSGIKKSKEELANEKLSLNFRQRFHKANDVENVLEIMSMKFNIKMERLKEILKSDIEYVSRWKEIIAKDRNI
jgi:hypothetical protein